MSFNFAASDYFSFVLLDFVFVLLFLFVRRLLMKLLRNLQIYNKFKFNVMKAWPNHNERLSLEVKESA